MRKMLSAVVASLAVAGGAAAIAGAAHAQPYGYYTGPGHYGYRYDPPRAYGYGGGYTPYSYYNGYNDYGGYQGYGGNGYYGSSGAALAGALLGAMIAPEVLGHAPYDEFGPDPNGMIAPDGPRIKCKLVNGYDSYDGRYRTRRQCW